MVLAGLSHCTPVVAGNKIPVFAIILNFEPGFNEDFGSASVPPNTRDSAITTPILAADLRPTYASSDLTQTTSGAPAPLPPGKH